MSISILSPSEITINTPTGEDGQQSAHSSSGLLQDLTKDLQRSSQFPITCGGYGDIHRCHLVRSDGTVPVAVKTIRALQSDNEALMQKNRKRIRRELKVWGRLKHNSILPLWGVASGFGPYLAMVCPWADNGALTGYLERQEDTLTLEDKFVLLTDIALGLQYLHSKSIIHGDLTGSNVLIYGNGRACVADFGLSTMIEEFVGTSYLTSSIRGHIRWAAAELFCIPEGDGEDDASVSLSVECDIYSFGSIILQVLTCKVPYYDVKKDNVLLGCVVTGKKPELPKGSQVAPPHWEFIQQCWLPRASRPSIGDIVLFVHQQYCELRPNETIDDGDSSGKSSGIWFGTWSGNWSGHWSDSDSDEDDESDGDSSSGTDQDAEGEDLDEDTDDEEDDGGQHGSEGDKHNKRGEGNEGVDRDVVVGLDEGDGSNDNDSSSKFEQEVEREDFNEIRDDKIVEGDEGHEGSEDENDGEEEDDKSSKGVEGDNDYGSNVGYESYADGFDGGADDNWSYDSDGSW